jgi:hypothetical protein
MIIINTAYRNSFQKVSVKGDDAEVLKQLEDRYVLHLCVYIYTYIWTYLSDYIYVNFYVNISKMMLKY